MILKSVQIQHLEYNEMGKEAFKENGWNKRNSLILHPLQFHAKARFRECGNNRVLFSV